MDENTPTFPLNRFEMLIIAVLLVLVVALVGVIVIGDRDSDRNGDGTSGTAAAQLPRVVMLAPADSSTPNIQLVDLDTGAATMLTQAEHGVEDYAVSPGGEQIAFTQNNGDGTSDIWLVTVADGVVRPLTACVNARCSQPAWNPDDTQVIFQRRDPLSEASQGLSEPRTWIVDIRTLDTQLLFADPQVIGGDPLWSPDGSRIAVVDSRAGGIRVYDLAAETETLISVISDVTGTFSPDGVRLIYPVLLRGLIGQQFYTHLEIANFEDGERVRASGSEDTPVEDSFADWSPDGETLVIARRYLDARYTSGKQIYALDLASGDATPLVVDGQYTHAAPQWDAAGQRVVYQRFDLITPDAVPEIWVTDLATDSATLVAANAFFPAWVR